MNLTIVGWIVCPIIGIVLGWLVASLKKNNTETKALKSGVQALLRDRLLQSYKYYTTKGYADFEDRDNFENMYCQYHNLGQNGVMDDMHRRFLELPTQPPSHDRL